MWGIIDPTGSASAEIVVLKGESGASTAWDVYSMLTATAALLLGRSRQALMHAGAVVAPGGGAWLVVGDSHSGKTTTTISTVEAGWSFVSDDQVVLGYEENIAPEVYALAVQGWPRYFHVDEGWDQGVPTGRRGSIHPHERWPGRWSHQAPLAGLLFPKVVPEQPTILEPVTSADAIVALLRQSPWFMVDPTSAREGLKLLQALALLPAYRLRLGLDTYADGPALTRLLSQVAG